MPRSDRLPALVDYLRRRRTSVTVEELAVRFGVTPRTIHRDLATLRDRAIAIKGEPGRGGGLRLAPDHALPPLMLTPDEAIALWLAVRLGLVSGALPARDTVLRAADKVLAALPAPRRAALDGLVRRVVVGVPARSGLAAEAKATPAATFTACAEAFTREHALELRYVDRQGTATRRVVEPHGLLTQWPLWYLLAIDLLRGAPRMFRLDRIRSVRPLPDRRFQPRDPRALFAEIEAARIEAAG